MGWGLGGIKQLEARKFQNMGAEEMNHQGGRARVVSEWRKVLDREYVRHGQMYRMRMF